MADTCDRLLLLDGALATAEPTTLRYRLLHNAVRIIDHARRRILRVPETWTWARAQDFANASNRELAIS